MKKTITNLSKTSASVLIAGACCVQTQAQSADALIDKLVEKGVLTVKEANDLREETDKGFTAAYAVKSGMPEWVNSVKFYGDLRGRFEGFYSSNPNFVDRNRFRYRLRPGFTIRMKDNFEVGFRLTSSEAASGGSGGDPVSGNATFTSNASKKFVYIDLAYARWSPLNGPDWTAATTFGKMENPFVFPSTVMFDKDYTPEGLAQEFGYRINDDHGLRLIGGGFAINELGASSDDAFLLGTQLRLDSKWTKKLSSSVGVGWFGVVANDDKLGHNSINTDAVPDQQRGNTRDGAGNPLAKFNPIYADVSLTYTLETFPLYAGAFPITIGGDYVHNPATSTKNEGYTARIFFGKAGKKGTYEIGYQYMESQADAWYEETTESDFGAFYEAAPVGGKAGYGAGTNVRGHILKASYSPYDSLTLTVMYFMTELIDKYPSISDSKMGRLQVDAVWKF